MLNIKGILALERFLLTKPIGKDIPLSVGETVKAKVQEVLSSGSVVLKIKDGYLTVNSNIKLQKDQEILLKVLSPKDNKIQLEIISIDGKSIKNSNVSTSDIQENILNNLKILKEAVENGKIPIKSISNFPDITLTVKDAIKNSGLFYEKKVYDFYKLITQLESKLPSDLIPKLKEINTENYKEKVREIKSQINDSEIQQRLTDLETTITSIKEDLKFITQDSKTLESLSNLQILSLLSDSGYGVFNLSIPQMKIGNFEIKRVKKENEEIFYFKGNIEFDDGKVDFLVAKFTDGYFISIKVENPDLREKMKGLKKEIYNSLNSQNIKVVSLDVF
ncbi:hypothetical protein [Sulfurihydrogenibium sp.]|uniref:hypothetical protein n=1 Tax=Sulfurihydrogenibium sp. TaxID=2053621 RepID=UPI00260E086D|nr:hypothetical protein [Sulfurihydrogenibium sp.]